MALGGNPPARHAARARSGRCWFSRQISQNCGGAAIRAAFAGGLLCGTDLGPALQQVSVDRLRPTDATCSQRQIEATDEEIDALVYELYGLTEKEIAIVEGQDH